MRGGVGRERRRRTRHTHRPSRAPPSSLAGPRDRGRRHDGRRRGGRRGRGARRGRSARGRRGGPRRARGRVPGAGRGGGGAEAGGGGGTREEERGVGGRRGRGAFRPTPRPLVAARSLISWPRKRPGCWPARARRPLRRARLLPRPRRRRPRRASPACGSWTMACSMIERRACVHAREQPEAGRDARLHRDAAPTLPPSRGFHP